MQEAYEEFQSQWRRFSIINATSSLIKKSDEIAKNFKIKGCDAFQLASALQINISLFVSSDTDLNIAATENGLSVWNPITDPIPPST